MTKDEKLNKIVSTMIQSLLDEGWKMEMFVIQTDHFTINGLGIAMNDAPPPEEPGMKDERVKAVADDLIAKVRAL